MLIFSSFAVRARLPLFFFKVSSILSFFFCTGKRALDIAEQFTFQLGLADTIGSLTVGHAADIAVFKPVQSENVFGDRPSGAANQLLSVGHTIYKPMLTVKNGEMVYRDMLF